MEINEQLIKRIQPHSKEAEQSVIGSMLLDKDACIYAIEHLRASEFYLKQNELLFEAMSDLSSQNKAIDFLTLQEKLKEMNAPAEVCELGFVQELVDAVPTVANIDMYVGYVHENAQLRALIKATEDITNKCYAKSGTKDEILMDAEKQIFDIIQAQGSEELTPIKDVVMNTLSNIQAASKTKGSVTGIPTGFTDLDNKTAGLQKSDLILVAARPSMGKTAFVLNVAQHACFKKDMHVCIFSLEMSKEQLVNRLMSMETNVDSMKLRTGNLTDNDWSSIVEGAGIIGNSNLMIDDTPGIDVMQLRSKCRRMKIEKGLDLIIIDYLQLMSGRGKSSDSRQQEISDISRSLKAVARELNVPVIALSQLSRAVEQRQDHRPMLSDLRESGAIEQDADVVMFIYRDEYYNPESEKKGIAEIIVAKQRNGAIGTVELVWLPDYTRFVNKEHTIRE